MLIKLLFLLLITNTALAERVFWGKKVSVGKGYARTFVGETKKGRILEVGIALSHMALKGLSHDMKVYQLPLSDKVKVPPFKYITMDWNPHGHDPDEVYGAPHFDFHFYFVSKKYVSGIMCDQHDKKCLKEVPKKFRVPDYVPTPGGVPKMGWHWIDSLAPEFNGGKFSRTYIYGYYDAKPIFLEPMVTLKYLQSKSSGATKVRLPVEFYFPGLYPSSYDISYDKSHKLHKITLKHFRKFNK